MPNWNSHIEESLRQARAWSGVSDLRSSAARMYQDSWTRTHPGRTRANFPKPSVPTVQNILRVMLRRRQAIGKLGVYGAAYFVSMENYRSGTLGRNPRASYRNWNLRRRCNEFNERVDLAFRNSEAPIPDPWEGNPTQRSARATPQQVETPPPSGPILEEPLNIIRQLYSTHRYDQWDEMMRGIMDRLPRDRVDQLIRRVPANLRGHITNNDLAAVIMTALDQLIEQARAREATEPKGLEEEYYQRLAAKGEQLD